MKKKVFFELETVYREPFQIVGYDFGNEDAENTVAIVGAMRGNEVQQMYTAAHLVETLRKMEEDGFLNPDKRIRIIPSLNHFSMNVGKRFWAVDNTDINRMFPGYDLGETTQRISEGIFKVVKDFQYGMQLCSFYLPGDFLPHVRVSETDTPYTEESLKSAELFGLPYVVRKKASPFDTTTLNYNWQIWETQAFSLYGKETDRLNLETLQTIEYAILRFLRAQGIINRKIIAGAYPVQIDESEMIAVKAHKGGVFISKVQVGDIVHKGQRLGLIMSPLDGTVLEELKSPLYGQLFFAHTNPLINEFTSAFRIAEV